MSNWLNLVGSKSSWTVSLCFGASTGLLHHSAVSSTPRCVFIVVLANTLFLFKQLLNDSYYVYMTCLGGPWYCFPLSLTSKENVPFETPMPEKTLLYYLIHSILGILPLRVKFHVFFLTDASFCLDILQQVDQLVLLSSDGVTGMVFQICWFNRTSTFLLLSSLSISNMAPLCLWSISSQCCLLPAPLVLSYQP